MESTMDDSQKNKINSNTEQSHENQQNTSSDTTGTISNNQVLENKPKDTLLQVHSRFLLIKMMTLKQRYLHQVSPQIIRKSTPQQIHHHLMKK